ncbi:MAG: VPLPA-CTERM sorting domain-containing protein [Pseudomonadota bacterium]
MTSKIIYVLAAGISFASSSAGAGTMLVPFCGSPALVDWSWSLTPGERSFDTRTTGLSVDSNFNLTLNRGFVPPDICDGPVDFPNTVDIDFNLDWDFYADNITGPYRAEIGVDVSVGGGDGITLDDLPIATEQLMRAGTERNVSGAYGEGEIPVTGNMTQNILAGGANADLYQTLTVSAMIAGPVSGFVEVLVWDEREVDIPMPAFVPLPAAGPMLLGALGVVILCKRRRRRQA